MRDSGGFQAIMTRADHAERHGPARRGQRTGQADLVINVQADEPLVSGRQIGCWPG